MRVIDLLQHGTRVLRQAGCPEAERDAELIAMLALGWSREQLYRDLQEHAPEARLADFFSYLARRENREPIAYIRRKQEFRGLELEVTSHVLIPRPETEIIVEQVIELAPPNARIVDVGTGSGNIAVAIAHERKDLFVVAGDISQEALHVCARNLRFHSLERRIPLVCSSLLEPFCSRSLDIIASNPPYIALSEKDSLADEVRQFEPPMALYAGASGLDFISALIRQSQDCLKPGGCLLMEFGMGQGAAVLSLLNPKIWENASLLRDLQGLERTLRVWRAATSF